MAHRIADNYFLKLSKDLEDFKDLKWTAETVQQLPPPDHHRHHLKLVLLTGLTDGHSQDKYRSDVLHVDVELPLWHPKCRAEAVQ